MNEGREISRGSRPEPRDLGPPLPLPKTAHPYHPNVNSACQPVLSLMLEGLIAAAASGNMISASTPRSSRLARDRVRVLVFQAFGGRFLINHLSWSIDHHLTGTPVH